MQAKQLGETRSDVQKTPLKGQWQLVVTTGLDQSSCVDLTQEPVVLGGTTDCDLCLSDPGIRGGVCVVELDASAHHALLTYLKGSNASLYRIRNGHRVKVTDKMHLLAGDEIEIGGTRLSVRRESVPTTDSNVNPRRSAPGPITDERLRKKKEALDQLKARLRQKQHLPTTRRDAPVEKSAPANQRKPVSSESATDGRSGLRYGEWLKPGGIILSSLIISFWTLSAARGGADYPDKKVDMPAYTSGSASEEVLWVNQLPATAAGVEEQGTNGPDQPNQLHAYQLAFQHMLQARELPTDVQLSREGDAWVVSGVMPGTKLAILKRMIVRFQAEYQVPGQIINRVKPSERSLPFEIVQVTSGKYGNIVTDTGHRLFVGDELEGFRLAAIQEHQLIFTGKERVSVKW